MKILKTLVLSFLIISFIQPAANAGVVKQLVEVDPDQRRKDEEDRIRQQESYKEEAKQQKEEEIIEKAKQILDEQIPVVEPEPEPTTPPAPAPRVASQGEKDYSNCFICRPVGALTGLVVSPIIGLFRGGYNKAGDYAGAMGGDGVLGFVGAPVGAVSGAITGAVSGLGNGLLTGLVKGYQKPFSSESYSLADVEYDPYNFIGGF